MASELERIFSRSQWVFSGLMKPLAVTRGNHWIPRFAFTQFVFSGDIRCQWPSSFPSKLHGSEFPPFPTLMSLRFVSATSSCFPPLFFKIFPLFQIFFVFPLPSYPPFPAGIFGVSLGTCGFPASRLFSVPVSPQVDTRAP